MKRVSVTASALPALLPGETEIDLAALHVHTHELHAHAVGQTESLAGALADQLVLDGVQDPHNLGACLRVADAAGAHAVVAPKDRAVGLNATAVKVACGAADTVPYVTVTNLARALREMQERGIWTIGADAEADKDIYGVDLKAPLALVLGAEGSGLRRLTRETCDALVRIPMHGSVESLNVSVASGICLFEVRRQRSLGITSA
jgi:23S rRNA (guanosine2251-2'-O)-methyltransferase